jgi:hypothetical protein
MKRLLLFVVVGVAMTAAERALSDAGVLQHIILCRPWLLAFHLISQQAVEAVLRASGRCSVARGYSWSDYTRDGICICILFSIVRPVGVRTWAAGSFRHLAAAYQSRRVGC